MTKLLESKLREGKVKHAIDLYYARFGTEQSVTINEAAAKYAVNGIELHIYIAARTEAGLGMPETLEEARQYRNKLQQLG